MISLLLLIILIDSGSSIEIEQSPKQFKVYENAPNGTIIGTIRISPSNYQMRLIDNAQGRFLLDCTGQVIVSVFLIYSNRKDDGEYDTIVWTEF